jgi:uncharacterized membrane protein YccF (DUF307 family)
MSVIGNFLWFVCGGFISGLAWWFLGLVCFVTIIGIPWGRACFVMGNYSFFPFGKEAISRKELNQKDDIGTSVFGFVGNLIWFILAGLWLALLHVSIAALCGITIIGIPFAIAHLKLAGLALSPIGKTIVPKSVAIEVRASNARATLSQIRR